ncbi:MAG: signal peptidase I [Candidatus Thorarchaeota archaeon]
MSDRRMMRIRKRLKWSQRSEEAKTIILLAIVVLSTIAGYGVFMVVMGTTSPLVVVTSGSMEPTLYAGDLCIIQARADDQILLSDIIVYWDTTYHSDGPIIHRVVDIQIIDGEYFYYTKGDNNHFQDGGERTIDEVMGVVVATIPKLGHISLFLRTPPGWITIIIIFVLILVVPEFVCKNGNDKKSENGNGPTETTES